MRVLVISAAFPPAKAGEADHALHLSRNLAERGLDVHVLTTQGASTETAFKVHPIMKGWAWKDMPRLGRFLKKCAPDAVILLYSGWIYEDHPMITFAPSLSKKVLPRAPFVTQFETELGPRVDELSLLTRLIRKGVKEGIGSSEVDRSFGTLLRDSDAIIVLSDNYRRQFTQLLPRSYEKILLLPPPPIMHLSPDDAETRRRGRRELGVEPETFLLAYFGYIYKNKGIDVLLKALSIVAKRRDDVRLVLIGSEAGNSDGSAYTREVIKLAETLDVNGKIIWTGGYEADSDYASVCLRSADACVLPYDQGVTLNRSSFAAAVTHGLPTITTVGETVEPQFVNRKNVLLCPPKDPLALAGEIDELISDVELQKTLSCGALRLADEWFSWRQTMESTLTALKGAC